MARRQYAVLAVIASAGLLGACQTEVPAPVPQAAAPEPLPAAPIAWASAPDCRAKLGLLEQAVRSGRGVAGERPPIVVVLPGNPRADDWLAPPGVTIAADLPLMVHERSDLARLDARCVLMVDAPRDLRVEHRLVARDTVRSHYESGIRTERNPDYDLAQLRVRQAEREARDDGPGILEVGDPMLDLVGALVGSLVSGFSQGREERELDQAMIELTDTPRSRDRPVYRAYEFEQTTVLAGKEATIPIALLDRVSGQTWRAELRQRERREFAIIDGLDPRDRDYEARRAASLDRHQFERWQREPPRLQLSAVAAALGDTPSTVPASGTATPSAATIVSIADRRADLGQIEAPELAAAVAPPAPGADPWQSPAPARAATDPLPAAGPAPAMAPSDSRAAGVVTILADQGAGAGVYVQHDLVLTTATLVERASVAEVVTAEGGRVLGLVAQSDPLRNLALIQVGRPGAPVTLHDGPPPAAGRALEALVRNGAGGLTVAAGRYLGAGPATGLTVPIFVDLTYIEAPTLPDPPEATPWFLGDQLIALGTGHAADRAAGPQGAIGAGEILDFLYGAGGALAALR